jgi:hypothetical protein
MTHRSPPQLQHIKRLPKLMATDISSQESPSFPRYPGNSQLRFLLHHSIPGPPHLSLGERSREKLPPQRMQPGLTPGSPGHDDGHLERDPIRICIGRTWNAST